VSTILCITGMHRSGTSLTAGWLQACGVPVLDGGGVGAGRGNPRGHFEDADLVSAHDAALRAAVPGSHGWLVYTAAPLRFPPATLAPLRRLADARGERYALWGWKDPRTVLLLEEWKALRPALKTLLLWRSADEVVQSLAARARRRSNREKFLLWRGARLWQAYNRRVLAYRRAHPADTVMLELDDLLARDARAFELINTKFRLKLSYRPLAEHVQSGLLHRRPGSRARISAALFGATEVEHALRALSDPL